MVYASIVGHIISAALKELQNDEASTCNITITEAFPTEQAIRQKVQKKKRKEQLESEGKSKEGIKEITKRKAVLQEQHFDDCGSDTGPIEYSRTHLLALFPSTKRDKQDLCYYEWDTGQLSDSESEDDFRDYYYGKLLGSEIDNEHHMFTDRGNHYFVHYMI